MSGYRYTPLEEADAIRLLILNPSTDPTAPLSGSLLTTTISDCDADFEIEYLALSYVWGDPTRRGFIELDGFEVEITASLAEALQSLRNLCPEGAQRVWADALCINQSDVQEKNRQVPLMGNIFSHARTTVIYLGSLTANLAMIFDAARRTVPRVASVDAEGRTHIIPPRDPAGIGSEGLCVVEPPPPSAIKELSELPWFTRVWVFQELVLSRDPWVQCGSLRVRWGVLCALVIPILNKSEGPGATALQQMHSTYFHSGSLLLEILWSRNGCRATDPRDMIFAYMGMHKDREEVAEFVTVDYNLPLKQLLISTARYISKFYGFDRLLQCIKRPANSTWVDLPSWVPDWGISEWPEPNPLRRHPGCNRERCCISGHAEQLNLRYKNSHIRYSRNRRIRYLSPVLPAPGEFPPDFYGRCGAKEGCHPEPEEALRFIQNLELSSTKDGPLERLFPKEFWATYNIAPVAEQVLYEFHYGEMFKGYRRKSKHLQNFRLATTYGRGVIVVPAHVMVGDIIASFDLRSNSRAAMRENEMREYHCILRQVACVEVEASMGLFEVIWNDGGHEVHLKNYKSRHPDFLYKGPITLR